MSSTDLLPLTRAACFKSNSPSTGMQNTTCPVTFPFPTNVLNTSSGGICNDSAT